MSVRNIFKRIQEPLKKYWQKSFMFFNLSMVFVYLCFILSVLMFVGSEEFRIALFAVELTPEVVVSLLPAMLHSFLCFLLGIAIQLFVSVPLSVMIEKTYHNRKPDLVGYAESLRMGVKGLLLGALRGAITVLLGLLLIVPGVWYALKTSLATYIYAENPALGARGALKESMRVTKALGKTFWLTVLLFVGLAALFGVLSVLALFLAEAGIVVGVLVTVLYLTVVRLVRAYVGYALLEEAKKTCADLSE